MDGFVLCPHCGEPLIAVRTATVKCFIKKDASLIESNSDKEFIDAIPINVYCPISTAHYYQTFAGGTEQMKIYLSYWGNLRTIDSDSVLNK